MKFEQEAMEIDEKNPETESQTELKNLGFDSILEQSSPRTTLEIPISGGDSDNSSSSSSSNSSRKSCSSNDKIIVHETLSIESHGLHWRSLYSVIKQKSMRRASTFPPLKSSRKNRDLARICNGEERTASGSSIPKPTWRSFSFEELVAATDNFKSENLVGKGGHAEVFRGCLADGRIVAVKRLTKGKSEEERTGDFLSELGMIAHIDHPNAAHLIGFGVEGGLHLVLQFSPYGSLASLLHGSKVTLEWGIRFKVALGTAEGLLYLHQQCHRRIIHRDIKASNILLTQDYQPQISDFGLAKWLPDKWTHHIVSPIEGTFGYLAPEYFMHGIVDEKTDVFAFGVLLLELITGRRAVDTCRQSLVMWAKPLLEINNVKELVDPSLGNAYDSREMARVMSASSMCIHHMAIMRPYMNRVVHLLRGDDGPVEPVGRRDTRPKASRAMLLDSCDLEEYTCSTYLNDLNRYKQLALE